MGLLKKKSDEAAEITATPGAAVEAEPGPPAVDAAATAAPTGPEFASPPASEAGVLGVEAGAASDASEPEAGATDGAEPAADGSEALLNMFASSQAASDDRELLVELAGEVEVADLVDQARTLAAAMNIALAAD